MLERVLQWMNRGIFQPRGFISVAPGGQKLGHRHVLNVLPASLMILLLDCQSFVKNEARHAGELLQLAPLLAGWLDSELVRLASDHDLTVYTTSI